MAAQTFNRPESAGRRSSAAHELHLTKCYFYQQLAPNDDDDDAADGDDEDNDFDEYDNRVYYNDDNQEQEPECDEGVDDDAAEERYVENFDANGGCAGASNKRELLLSALHGRQRNPIHAVASSRQAAAAAGCVEMMGEADNTCTLATKRLPQPPPRASADVDSGLLPIRQQQRRFTGDEGNSKSASDKEFEASSTASKINSSHLQQHPQQHVQLASDSVGYNSASRCSTQISSSTATSLDQATTADHQFRPQHQVQRAGHLRRFARFCSGPNLRRNSSPNFERQHQQAEEADRRLSIEEQLKRLLDIKPELTGSESIEAAATKKSETRRRRSVIMKKSGGGGGNRDQQQQQQQQHQSYKDSYQQQQAFRQQQIEQQQQHQRRQASRASSSISPDDRLMIFMLASRSTSTNSSVERNARILKWLNNCKNAG